MAASPFTDCGRAALTRTPDFYPSVFFFSADREEHFQYQTPSALRSSPHGDSESWTNPPIGRRCVSPPRLGGLLLSDWIRPSLDTRSSWLFPAAAQGEISSPLLTFNFLHFRAAFDPPPASARCVYCGHGAAPEWLGFYFIFFRSEDVTPVVSDGQKATKSWHGFIC